MSRLASIFSALKAESRKAVMPYVTSGDPSIEYTASVLHNFVENGADIIEVGVPFSDPMADGPTVQLACERALQAGTNIMHVFEMIKTFRESNQTTGIVLMGYANPVEALGYDKFIALAKEAGVDGILVVDFPPEESQQFAEKVIAADLDPIFLAAPTTETSRLPKFSELGRGFLYYVSFKGITGAAHLDVEDVQRNVDRIKQHCDLPVAVGFGIRDAESASAIAKFADGVVIGSALVKLIENNVDDLDKATAQIAALMKDIRTAVDAN